MYDEFLTPKLLQACTLPGELKWNTNERSRGKGVNVKSAAEAHSRYQTITSP